MRWAGHVACIGIVYMCAEFSLRNLKGGDHSTDLGVDGRIIFKWILEKWGFLNSSG
jgi:hypothetical protein